MFLTSILVRALQQLVGCNEEEDAAALSARRDRFSDLPDALLLNILERVDTLDAVRACILSNRLLKLPDMLARIAIDVCDFSEKYKHPTKLDFHDMVRANRAVADLTDKILTTRPPQLTIRDLDLTFVLIDDHCLSIGRSVARAMATRKLDTVQFNILTEKHAIDCTLADFVRFGKQFNAFFVACQDAFAGLTVLKLQNLTFGESDLPNILRTCERLEYLCLDYWDAGEGSVLKFEHNRLLELEIVLGEYETLELCCLPKLQRVTCEYWQDDATNPLIFGFVPQLSKLSLTNEITNSVTTSDMNLRLSQLLANVSSICDLRLDFKSKKIWVQPESPRVLSTVISNLRTVNLDNLGDGCDITWTMFILEAAPCLEELCITVWDRSCKAVPNRVRSEKTDVKWKPSDSNFKHYNLAKLTIFGFQPDNNFAGYVARVMKAAVRILKVTLHDGKVCKVCAKDGVEFCPLRYQWTSKKKDLCLEKIREALVMLE